METFEALETASRPEMEEHQARAQELAMISRKLHRPDSEQQLAAAEGAEHDRGPEIERRRAENLG